MFSMILLTTAAPAGLIAVAFLFLIRKALYARNTISTDVDWINEFSVAKYRPMERLLSDEDNQFLESQPGACPNITRKFRAERRAIFRQYLRCLSNDFNRLCGAVQVLMLTSGEDRPDLAAALLKHRVTFAYAMFTVRARLLLHFLGIGGVDVRGLVDVLDAMRLQLQQLTPATQAAAC